MATENMNIQWYPGHMTKTRRQIEADLKQVDAVCEIVDARIPVSSRNPDIDSICGNKPRIIILNRMDLADPEATKKWMAYFRSQGMAAVAKFRDVLAHVEGCHDQHRHRGIQENEDQDGENAV